MSDVSAQPERFGRPDSVEVCLEIAREVLVEQRARARHLDTKTASLAGFCATVLTLNVTLGRSLLNAHLARGAHVLTIIFFLAAALLLATSVGAAAIAVLKPMDHEDLTAESIDAYG